MFFLKNFNISLTFLNDFARIEEGSLLKIAGLFISLLLLLLLVFTLLTFRVNFDEILFLKEVLLLLVMSKFHPDL